MICSGKKFLTTEVWEKIITSKSPVEKVMSEYISTNSGIHHQFRLYYKLGGNASQLWVSSCSTNIQWVASGKKSAFYLHFIFYLWSLPDWGVVRYVRLIVSFDSSEATVCWFPLSYRVRDYVRSSLHLSSMTKRFWFSSTERNTEFGEHILLLCIQRLR